MAPLVVSVVAVGMAVAAAAAPPLSTAQLSTAGVFPAQAFMSSSAPKRSEAGVGAMMAWADRLWVVTYLSVPNAGSGTGLYSIDETMALTLVASHNSTYANRLLVPAMQSIVIGPYVIDAAGGVRTIEALLSVRIGGMSMHLTDPTKVYMLGMDAQFWEVDLITLNVTLLFDLVTELHIPADQQPHFKAAHTMGARVWVVSNTYDQMDALSQEHGGRLATWRGPGSNWTIVEENAFFEVTGRQNFGCAVYATGADSLSAIMHVTDTGCDFPSYNESLQTYRLPKATQTQSHLWTTEWPRIREIETERYLMDVQGMYYELAPLPYGGATWHVRPIASHLRMVPDFASYRGLLALGGNQVSSIFDNNLVTGQSQAGIAWMTTDDLWKMGKPQGSGGVWRSTVVADGEASVPFLMTGFEHKVAHLRVEGNSATSVDFELQVDFTGQAGFRSTHFYIEPWNSVTTVTATSAAGGYAFFVFPTGFSAHWVRVVAHVAGGGSANVTAWFIYT